MAGSVVPSHRWLFGPVPDLLLGCGLLYVIAFGLFAVAGPEIRQGQLVGLAPILVLLFGAPHYGATYLRVYENRSERRRYAVFAVHATVAMALLFVAGLHSPLVGALLLTVYLSWSPWHYTGQNYGLAVMFLRRRGVSLDPLTKRLLHASFTLSFLLAFAVMHESGGAASDTPVDYTLADAAEGRVRFLPLGIPREVARILLLGLGAGYLAALGAAAVRLLRRAPAADLLPTAALVTTQALWFSAPFALRHWQVSTGIEPLDWQFRSHYFVWIAAGHAIQYLWICTWYARSAPRWRGVPAYLGKTFLAGPAVWALPLIVFAPWALGSFFYEGAVLLVLASAINIHHFILDGAIWKLRDSRIASVLLRASEPETSDAREPARWPRRLVWSVAACGMAAAVLSNAGQVSLARSLAFDRTTEAMRNLDWLAWFGRDTAPQRLQVARRLWELGLQGAAKEQLARSLELAPSVGAWSLLARIEEDRHDWAAAIAAYEAGLAIEPDRLGLLHRAGVAWLQLERPDRARPLLERALAVRPGYRPSRRSLDELEQRWSALPAAAGGLQPVGP